MPLGSFMVVRAKFVFCRLLFLFSNAIVIKTHFYLSKASVEWEK